MRLVGVASITPTAAVAPLSLMPLVFTPFMAAPFMFSPFSCSPIVIAAIGNRDRCRCIRDRGRRDVDRFRWSIDADGHANADGQVNMG
jgi:hypothetical protein